VTADQLAVFLAVTLITLTVITIAALGWAL